MEEAPTPLNITQKGKKISISKKIEINENNGKQKLNIIIEKDYIIFKILYQDPILNEYSCKYSLNEIKSLHKMFSSISSFNEFFDYINNLSINNRISIQKQEGFIIINLEAEYLFKKYNIQMKLFKEKLDIELNFINVFKQLTGLKNLIKTIYNENKILKEELAQKKNEIKKLFEDNNNLKTEKEKVDKLLKEKNDNENIIVLNNNAEDEHKEKNRIKIAIKDKKSKDNDVIIEDLEQKYKTLEKLMKIKFDELNNEIEDLKSKLAEKIEFKIEPRKKQNIFLNLEDKLSMIMAKGEADKNDIEEIKKISKQIIEGTDVSPTEIIMDFFKSNMNNLTTYSIDNTSLQRLVDLKVKICGVISVYEPELKMRIKIEKEKQKEKNIKGKEKEKKNINVIHIIDEFRKEYNLDKDTFNDDRLMAYLQTYKNDKREAFKALMNRMYGGK